MLELLKMILNFVLGPPLPRGVPGEGPDYNFPKEIDGFLPDSGGLIYIFSFHVGFKHS